MYRHAQRDICRPIIVYSLLFIAWHCETASFTRKRARNVSYFSVHVHLTVLELERLKKKKEEKEKEKEKEKKKKERRKR